MHFTQFQHSSSWISHWAAPFPCANHFSYSTFTKLWIQFIQTWVLHMLPIKAALIHLRTTSFQYPIISSSYYFVPTLPQTLNRKSEPVANCYTEGGFYGGLEIYSRKKYEHRCNEHIHSSNCTLERDKERGGCTTLQWMVGCQTPIWRALKTAGLGKLGFRDFSFQSSLDQCWHMECENFERHRMLTRW